MTIYCVFRQWIDSLSQDANFCFLRATALGLDLSESWIVCSAGAYIWNYYNHKLQKGRENEIVHPLQTLLDGLKKLGHSG